MGVTQLISIFILLFLFLFPSPCNSISSSMQNTFTLYGDANLIKEDAITLTQEDHNSNSKERYGRALYKYPIRFLDPLTNTSMSFSCEFSFTITTSPGLPWGDGLAFMITSNATSVSHANGHFGLPESKDSFFAVEFDTSFDPDLGDIDDDHVGVDIDSVVSFVSVGIDFWGINLKIGKEITAWIHYEEKTKMLNVWVSDSHFKPTKPVISTNIDLGNKVFKEFMHIGFTASNRREGSSWIVVQSWQFNTFGLVSSRVVGEQGCSMCFNTDKKFTVQGGELVHSRQPSVKTAAVVGLAAGAALLILSTVVTTLCVQRDGGDGVEPQTFTLAQIRAPELTNDFANDKVIGVGTVATVFGGSLHTGETVAVKRFVTREAEALYSFEHERAVMLAGFRHPNIVRCIGECREENELVLVFERLTTTLDARLQRTSPDPPSTLNWVTRKKIVFDVASGLKYLHTQYKKQVIHRDIKSTNILLDNSDNAKLGDFGLTEFHGHWNFHARKPTKPGGSPGYVSPELSITHTATVKTDIFSFGVLILEVATGRLPFTHQDGRLSNQIWQMWGNGNLLEAADGRLQGVYVVEEMRRMLMVGLLCTHNNPDKRPTVKEAVRIIRGAKSCPSLPLQNPECRVRPVRPPPLRLQAEEN